MLAVRAKAIGILFPVAFFFVGPWIASSQDSISSQQLIAASNAASDLSKLASYRLIANVVVHAKKDVVGSLTVERDHDNQRQELTFKDYTEIELIRGESGYVSRKPPLYIDYLGQLNRFDELWQADVPPDAKLESVTSSSIRNTPVFCFNVRPDKETHIKECFDRSTHLLVSREEKTFNGSHEVLFSDYRESGGIHFPSAIRFIEPDAPVIEARNISVVATSIDSARFTPPADAREFKTCPHIQRARLIRRVEPDYPTTARIAHIQGDVHITLTIGEDGIPRDFRLIAGHPFLAEASVRAVKQWKFAPAACPSGPVPEETIIKISFHM
jgi:TonB family protein